MKKTSWQNFQSNATKKLSVILDRFVFAKKILLFYYNIRTEAAAIAYYLGSLTIKTILL